MLARNIERRGIFYQSSLISSWWGASTEYQLAMLIHDGNTNIFVERLGPMVDNDCLPMLKKRGA